MKTCPFCPIQKKTDWCRTFSDGTIICRDLKNRGYKLRVLAVHSGQQWHHEKNWYSEELQERLKSRAVEVANILISRKVAERIAHIDDTHFSIPQHYHLQVAME